jgi:nucleoside-diphosphate-sugar epimerase
LTGTTHLAVFGAGYSGSAIAASAAASGWSVNLVTRRPEGPNAPGITLAPFAAAGPAIAAATHIVATAAPDDAGDPVLACYAASIAAAPALRWIGYLSTTGVYGDHAGGWVDETTPPAPSSDRSRRRVAAEQAWSALSSRLAVDLFRLAGIYGPGRSAIEDLRAGRARRVSKPGHLFGRIHRDDIAGAVCAAIRQQRPPGLRVLNLADDEPAASADVIAEAARLLGQEPPPLIPFAEAEPGMSAMGRSFWSDNRKVASRQTQAALGYRWRHPTYREGLRAILDQPRDGGGE